MSHDNAPTWHENAHPTPEQLADYLAAISREKRIEVAEVLLDAMDRADRCFLADHEGRLAAIKAEMAAATQDSA
ncbi:hypothetical protein LRP67_16330 [Nocardioides sp. cx-169]|uniref:hypothetical protein n=1 Tax=Nocardioides sp. cx-169 TaxID=2899080 RepID=UPI001E5D934E|nr:hypothetical protein [Nocardioides sp. cx-169]MCD4535661.1 hypothetical protein [Nocardioides sp. cx-169]